MGNQAKSALASTPFLSLDSAWSCKTGKRNYESHHLSEPMNFSLTHQKKKRPALK